LVAKYLKGETGLLFTNKSAEDAEFFFKTFAHTEFANPGESAITTVELMPGKEVFQNFSSSNEQYLRKLGLDLCVEDGKINLEKPYLAAEVSKQMNVNQTRVLKFLGIKLAEFKLTPVFRWDKDGKTKEY
jgi:mRNA turnover protein 4